MKGMIALFIIAAFYSTSAYSRMTCFKGAFITRLAIGYVASSNEECPDSGNCISFDYSTGGITKTSYVQVEMNLNDDLKGMAMYDMLKTAMILGYRVTGWSEYKRCTGVSPQIDGVSIK